MSNTEVECHLRSMKCILIPIHKKRPQCKHDTEMQGKIQTVTIKQKITNIKLARKIESRNTTYGQ